MFETGPRKSGLRGFLFSGTSASCTVPFASSSFPRFCYDAGMNSLQQIEHPAAWWGEDLVKSPEWTVQLSDAEIDELLAVAEQIDFSDTTPLEQDGPLPNLPRLSQRLKQVQHDLEHASGVARIRGFPAESVSLDLAKRAMWCISRHVGTPVSQSARGERMFSVQDAGFATDDARARGPNTSKRLSFHTDRCDVIAFLCYRQAKSGGDNDVVSSMTIFNEMLAERPDLVATLLEPYLYQRHNVDTGNELPYIEQPVFSFFKGHFAANLLRVLIERAYAMPETPDMTPKQREALDVLEAIAERPQLRLTFRQNPGDILFLNNFVTFHRRTEFIDYEESDRRRHLLRVWLSMPNSRPLDPRFAGNYGQTAAGAVRGGMKRR